MGQDGNRVRANRLRHPIPSYAAFDFMPPTHPLALTSRLCPSLSEDQSLLSMPPWVNKYLIGATTLSMLLHFAILYIPFLAVRLAGSGPGGGRRGRGRAIRSFGPYYGCVCIPSAARQDMFSINPLPLEEWKVVLAFSLPVILLDEILKLVSRLSSTQGRCPMTRAQGRVVAHMCGCLRSPYSAVRGQGQVQLRSRAWSAADPVAHGHMHAPIPRCGRSVPRELLLARTLPVRDP